MAAVPKVPKSTQKDSLNLRFKNPPTLCLRSYLIPFTARSQNPVVIVTYDESSAPLAPLPLTFSTVGAKALFGVGISGSGAGR